MIGVRGYLIVKSMLIIFASPQFHKQLLASPTIVAHDVLSEDGERLTTVLGAMILAFGYIRNYRLCRKKKCKV